MQENEYKCNQVSGTSPTSKQVFLDGDQNYWKQQLLVLQESAPKPIIIRCSNAKEIARKPSQYGEEFHGMLSREATEKLLSSVGEGAYLVRESQRAPGAYTLCLYFDSVTKNYKLYYDGQHYVGEKRFRAIHDLVADGLIHMYIEKHAADYIRRMAEETVYEESPYNQYQKRVVSERRKAGSIVRSSNRKTSSPVPRLRLYHHQHSSPSSTSAFTSSSPTASNGTGTGLSRKSNDDMSGAGSSGESCSSLSEYYQQQKQHEFQAHTWKAGGAWCDYCRNWMWGLIQQGFKCRDCGFSAHRKCSELVLPDCRPDLKYVKRTFAVDLVTLSMAHNAPVPPLVIKLITEIERRGVETLEGLYRISGFHEEIESLRTEFDTKGNIELTLIDDVNSIAGVLKQFFRLLPIPLITYSAYTAIMQMLQKTRTDSERVKHMSRLFLEELPNSHYATLSYLITHLNRVSQASATNKMTDENLARIFAPSLMRSPSPSSSIAMAQYEQYVLQLTIANSSSIFATQ